MTSEHYWRSSSNRLALSLQKKQREKLPVTTTGENGVQIQVVCRRRANPSQLRGNQFEMPMRNFNILRDLNQSICLCSRMCQREHSMILALRGTR